MSINENRSQIQGDNVRNIYKTTARNAVLSLFASNPDRHFSAEQVCVHLCGTDKNGIGKSTVYRQLTKLCEQNKLRRFEGRDFNGGAIHVYQYAEPEHCCEYHFHLKCVNCGKVIHLDCVQAEGLMSHIRSHHDFSVDCGSSILYGICVDCESISSREAVGDHVG